MTCQTCICYDEKHRWCVMGASHEPDEAACEYYIKMPDDDCEACRIAEDE